VTANLHATKTTRNRALDLYGNSFSVELPGSTKPPAQTPAVSNQATPQPAASAATTPATASTPLPAASPSVAANTTPHRTITIKTPLYETKLDSLGAEAISWIIKKNKDSDQDIYSVAGDKKTHVPLELVSQEGLKRQPRQAPLQLSIRDASVDALLSSTNYVIDGVGSTAGDSEVTLRGRKETNNISCSTIRQAG